MATPGSTSTYATLKAGLGSGLLTDLQMQTIADAIDAAGGMAGGVIPLAHGSTATLQAGLTSVRGGSGATTLTLPAGVVAGTTCTVKDADGLAGTYTITVNYDGTYLIDGNTAAAITEAYDSYSFIFDGNGWTVN